MKAIHILLIICSCTLVSCGSMQTFGSYNRIHKRKVGKEKKQQYQEANFSASAMNTHNRGLQSDLMILPDPRDEKECDTVLMKDGSTQTIRILDKKPGALIVSSCENNSSTKKNRIRLKTIEKIMCADGSIIDEPLRDPEVLYKKKKQGITIMFIGVIFLGGTLLMLLIGLMALAGGYSIFLILSSIPAVPGITLFSTGITRMKRAKREMWKE